MLQEDVLFLLVDADSSVILEKLEQGLKEGLKAAVHEEEEQFGQPGGLKLDWTGLEVRLLKLNPCVLPRLLERLEEFELVESFIHDFTGMFIGAELSMMILSLSHSLLNSPPSPTASEVVPLLLFTLTPLLWPQLRSRTRRRKNSTLNVSSARRSQNYSCHVSSIMMA